LHVWYWDAPTHLIDPSKVQELEGGVGVGEGEGKGVGVTVGVGVEVGVGDGVEVGVLVGVWSPPVHAITVGVSCNMN